MLTITTGIRESDKRLISKLEFLIDALKRGCYPGEEVQTAQHIVAKMIKRFHLEPYEVKFKLKTRDGWGHRMDTKAK